MSGNLQGFNANDIEPNQALSPVPAGDYEVIIAASELLPTSSGTGRMLKLTLQITKGPFQNRKLFDNLNIDNPSAMAVQIARGTLSAICRAVGVLTPSDSSELHNRPLMAKVVVKPSEEYGPQNKVKGYAARVLGAPQAAPQQAAPQPVAAGAAGGKPWA